MIVVTTTMPRRTQPRDPSSVLDPLLLRIDLDRDVDPVSGHVSAGDGPARGFAGWTELFTALQQAVTADSAARRPAPRFPEVGRP